MAMCAGILCVFGVLPSATGWVTLVAGIPNLANIVLLSNPHLMLKLLTNFEVLFLTAITTMATAGMFDVFKFDGRAGFAALIWTSTLVLIFTDASHSSHRKPVTAAIAFGIVGFLLFLPGFYFGAFPDLNARNIDLSLSNDVDISFNNVLFIVDKLTTILLFFGKNLFTAIRKPGCYVNLKSRLTGERVTAGELRKRLGDRRTSIGNLAPVASLNRRGGGRGRGRGRGGS